jgi:hypothetical protein
MGFTSNDYTLSMRQALTAEQLKKWEQTTHPKFYALFLKTPFVIDNEQFFTTGIAALDTLIDMMLEATETMPPATAINHVAKTKKFYTGKIMPRPKIKSADHLIDWLCETYNYGDSNGNDISIVNPKTIQPYIDAINNCIEEHCDRLIQDNGQITVEDMVVILTRIYLIHIKT